MSNQRRPLLLRFKDVAKRNLKRRGMMTTTFWQESANDGPTWRKLIEAELTESHWLTSYEKSEIKLFWLCYCFLVESLENSTLISNPDLLSTKTKVRSGQYAHLSGMWKAMLGRMLEINSQNGGNDEFNKAVKFSRTKWVILQSSSII